MHLHRELEEMGHTHKHSSSLITSTIALAEKIGRVINFQNRSTLELLQVKPNNSLQKNTYSGNYGYNELPLHTDLAHWAVPPRYLMLRSIIPSAVVSTKLLHHSFLTNEFEDSTISRALFKPRRSLDGHKFMLRLKQGGIFRWDKLFLVPENKDAIEIVKYCNTEQLAKISIDTLLSEEGDYLIIDNWNTLHGRSGVPELDSNRLLHRIYLSEIYA